MTTRQLFAAILREARLQANLTQQQAAEKAGMNSKQYISDLERAVRYPTALTLEKLEKAYGVKFEVSFSKL